MKKHPYTILLVEDEALIALTEKHQLAAAGYEVDHVLTGEAAVTRALDPDSRPDLVLMDIDLGPGIDGTEAAQQILSEIDIPVVFLSSHTEPEVVEKTEKITSYGYVVKNSGITVLDASIKMAFRLFEANEKLQDELTNRKRIETALTESEVKFRALFEKGPIGVAYHEMVYDDAGRAIDYRFIDANESYMALTGVDPRGKLVTEAFPGIENGPFDWIGTFGHVAQTGEQIRVEQYVEPNNRWYDCVGYQVKPDHFVAAFVEIMEQKKAEQSASAALENHRILLDNIPTQIWYLTDTTMYGAVNEAYAQFRGVSKDDLAFKDMKESLPDEVVAQCLVSNAEVFRTRKPVVSEEWVPDASGERRLLSIIKTPKFDENGEVEYVVCVADDITERKRMEEELKEQNLLLQMILENSVDLIAITDLEGNSLLASNSFELLGYDAGSQIGTNIMSFVHPDDLERIAGQFGSILRFGKRETGEFRFRRANGEYLWFESTGTVLKDENGVPKQILFNTRDVTMRKRVEDALRESEEKYLSLFNQAVDAIYVHDFDGNLIEVNNAACEQTGYSRDELLQLSVFDIHVTSEATTNLSVTETKRVWKQSAVGERRSFQAEHKRKDGTVFPVRLSTGAIRYGNDTVIMAIVEDIADRKVAEQEIQRQLADKETLLREVHHRIKNNMAQVEGLLSLQADSVTSPEARVALQEAISRVCSIRSLYEKLLVGNRYETVSMKDYLEGLIDSLADVFGEHQSVRIEKRLIDHEMGSQDVVPIGIILNELVTNAFKYAFRGRDEGHLRISLERSDADLTLTVEDNGIGFNQTTAETTKPGFGLSLVEMLAGQLDGTFSISCDKGTRSVVTFPV